MRYFHFTLGPVQGFVAQARRTRDFWAGSFLLSYLAGVAMREVIGQEGKIVFPLPDESYLQWIDGALKPGEPPKHGGIPNRFLAEVPEDFDPQRVEKAVKRAWRELAERVWQKDLQNHAGPETRKIWDRQINGFWEISWAMVEDPNDTGVLDRRKNWRSHYLQPEPGAKCMAMEGMQELSGTESPGEGEEFWEKLQKRIGETDLRENERLCAVAYVKRRFVHGFKDFEAKMPSGWTARGWELPKAVPSVTYIAAAPWLAETIGKAKENPEIENALWRLHDEAVALTRYSEKDTQITCVRKVGGHRKWEALDGHVFFEADLRDKKLFRDRPRAERVLNALDRLRDAAEPKRGPPSPYYALLLMDGDSLGRHMSDPAKRELISAALKTFTGEVQTVVERKHSGFLIYAGGDDVLALLTLDDALPCAAALRERYMEAFETRFQEKTEHRFTATISAAIQYAHYRLPFTKILADAHELLDDVAKDGRGRDAVAARVWKRSGRHLTWAQPWEIALRDGGVDRLAKQPRGDGGQGKTQAAGGFFYRMRKLFALLDPPKGQSGNEAIPEADMVKLLAYEYARSGIHGDRLKPEEAEAFIRPLLEQCRPMYRKTTDDPKQVYFVPAGPARYEADAALLARFLAGGGRERD